MARSGLTQAQKNKMLAARRRTLNKRNAIFRKYNKCLLPASKKQTKWKRKMQYELLRKKNKSLLPRRYKK